MHIFDLINIPLGYLFRYIYLLLQNYGWTLVVFTIITKAILLPLTIKQQKSMTKMQAIQPKLQELQKKYQYDQEKLNQETMKLYQTNKINPMGGCLPLLIQFPILIALYNIIRSPLTYVVQLGKHGLPTIAEMHAFLASLGSAVQATDQIGIAAEMSRFASDVAAKFPGVDIMHIDFTFFGLNLAQTPTLTTLSPILLIPVLAGLTTFLSSWLSTKMNGPSPYHADDDVLFPADDRVLFHFVTGRSWLLLDFIEHNPNCAAICFKQILSGQTAGSARAEALQRA